jgi:hypothetical protein
VLGIVLLEHIVDVLRSSKCQTFLHNWIKLF